MTPGLLLVSWPWPSVDRPGNVGGARRLPSSCHPPGEHHHHHIPFFMLGAAVSAHTRAHSHPNPRMNIHHLLMAKTQLRGVNLNASYIAQPASSTVALRSQFCWAPRQEGIHSVTRTSSRHGMPSPPSQWVLSLQATWHQGWEDPGRILGTISSDGNGESRSSCLESLLLMHLLRPSKCDHLP